MGDFADGQSAYGDEELLIQQASDEPIPNEDNKPLVALKKMAMAIGVAVTVLGMITSWIATGEVVQQILITYNCPFQITIYTRLGWILYLVVWFIWKQCFFQGRMVDGVLKTDPLGIFGWKHYLKWSTGLSLVGFYSGYVWYLSLKHTVMATNTALYQCGPVFVFLISIPLLGEKVTLKKVLSVGLCVGGAIAISTGKAAVITNATDVNSTSLAPGEKVFGYSMVFLSTLLYAVLEVVYKAKICHDADWVAVPNTFRFLGLLGCLVVMNFPVMPLLHYTGVEEFQVPPQDVLHLILLNGAIDAIFNISFYVCITLTSPLFCSLATILTMPVSILADIILKKHDNLTLQVYVGIVMIAIGFVMLTLAMGHGTPAPTAVKTSVETKKKKEPHLYE